MTESTASTQAAGESAKGEGTALVERLRDEADLCANEGADDIARLLNEAADALEAEQ